MPKHNPKLDKTRKNKKESYYKETDPYEDSQNLSPLYMAVIFISLIIVIAILFVFVFNDTGIKVEKYDNVLLDYDMYTYTAYEKHSDPFSSQENVWLNVCSRYDDTCEGEGLIVGFYDELIGRREGDIANFVFILKCIDKNMDGVDDFTGRAALSYGNTTDTYFNTDLILWFHIKDINKSSSATDLTAAYKSGECDENQLKVINYIIIINRKNPLTLIT